MAPKSLLESGQGLLAQGKFPLQLARRLHHHPTKHIKVVKPDFGIAEPDEGRVKATWLGHAGFMVQLPAPKVAHGKMAELQPTRVLIDPIWSDRASPTQWAGPKRRLPPPCSLKDLPEFHFVVTSHNHYDHLDWPTIEKILKDRGPKVHYIVPLGNKSWFVSGGVPPERIHEMDWWDSVELPRPDSNDGIKTRFICCPAQHGSGRGMHDQGATLWASWIVQEGGANTPELTPMSSSDTGYMTETGPCPAFKEIGDKYGPFDLAMVPIWRGGSLSFIAAMGMRIASNDVLDGLHASPAHALMLHKDIRSRHTIGMHFATFAGSDVEALEPVVELMEARDKQGVNDLRDDWGFGVIDVGATISFEVQGAKELERN
ncbi:Metallo-hydrolase/oxidoreductase [Polyporus arcularius HHB13444]|uniref:Metallo-hydrolase/oxidoreductase n=1 Tax=Polyporus arcularius HHB13444 TaxID=1314778 RepID=A0A5C3NYR0_9APHY|nr:Metallo-hydrolase/oxidoreductase [Polyporus arcularius HHB13444]